MDEVTDQLLRCNLRLFSGYTVGGLGFNTVVNRKSEGKSTLGKVIK